MKYFLDTEFLEGSQKTFFGKTKPTIDLISIGMVDENERTFYAISNEFNLKEAWNRHEVIEANTSKNHSMNHRRDYWIRDNVLRPIFNDFYPSRLSNLHLNPEFTYKNMKDVIKAVGVDNKSIANGICAFIFGDDCGGSGESAIEMAMKYEMSDKSKNPEFYGYYADYDWVVFCWIFGNMMSLPKGFPMYCRDLKQTLDEKLNHAVNSDFFSKFHIKKEMTLEEKLVEIKKHTKYPSQENEHNALEDAKWNKKFYDFLQLL